MVLRRRVSISHGCREVPTTRVCQQEQERVSVLVAKEIKHLQLLQGEKSDYTSLGPISICPCGSDTWHVKVKFDEAGEIGMYFRDMQCVLCSSLAYAPVPEL